MLALVFWNARQSRADRDRYREALIGFHAELNRNRPYGLRYSCTFAVDTVPWFRPQCEVYEDWYVLKDFAAIDAMNNAVLSRPAMASHEFLMKSTAGASAAILGLSVGLAQVQSLTEAYWVLKPRDVDAREVASDAGSDAFRRSFWTRSLALGPHEHLLLTNEPVDLPDAFRPIHVRKSLVWKP